MVRTRVVLANDPRAYREIIGKAIQQMRPHVEVLIVEPERLGSVVARTDLVIGSKLAGPVRDGLRVWVDLYPDGETLAITSVDGHRSRHTDIDLPQILSFVDAVHALNEKSG